MSALEGFHCTWNLIKITIIVIISKSAQGKTYVEYEAGKNAWAGWKSERYEIVGIVCVATWYLDL